MGLTSRAGVVPLSLLADVAGPITRTLEDAVRVFSAVARPDPDDPVTIPDSPEARAFSPRGRSPSLPDYAGALVRDGLKNARIGVLRQAYRTCDHVPHGFRPTGDGATTVVLL